MEGQEWIIYITTNLINMKVYVGQKKLTYNNKDNTYLGSGKAFVRALNKYGKENFNREILIYCYSQKEADFEETYWIDQLDSTNPIKGYNLTRGGNSPTLVSLKAVKCIETGIIYESLQDAERCTKIDASSISKVCRGKLIQSKGHTWQYVNEPSFKKIKESRGFKIYCSNNDKIYADSVAAGKELNLDPSTIRKVCNGKYNHVKGYVFKTLTN